MRLWSLHPSLLDQPRLCALWREGLGALKALKAWEGNTPCGYQNHPQLQRFKNHPEPSTALVYYLSKVHLEACRRGYNFDPSKLPAIWLPRAPLYVFTGQLLYEKALLERKGVVVPSYKPNPVFTVLPVFTPASWEKVKPELRYL